jgi:hypothetical protein
MSDRPILKPLVLLVRGEERPGAERSGRRWTTGAGWA